MIRKSLTPILVLTAALLLPHCCFGAEAAGIVVPGFSVRDGDSGITITGPTEAKTGDTITLYLSGTPSLDLAKPLLDQIIWLTGDDRMFAYLLQPAKPMVPLDVEGTIVFGAAGATMRPHVSFMVPAAGEYRLMVDWNFQSHQLVEHRITVASGSDDDDPPVPPDPTPGKLSVLLSYEAGDQPKVSPEQASILTDPTVRAYLDSHCAVVDNQPAWRFLDLSDDNGTAMPTAWQAAITRARGKPTPWLIIDNGTTTYEGPCPVTPALLLAHLQRYGGA